MSAHLKAWPRDAVVLGTTAFTNGLIGSSGRAGQNSRYTVESRRDASAAFLADDPAESGAMMPMVVGPDQLVGHLLLFGRQAGV